MIRDQELIRIFNDKNWLSGDRIWDEINDMSILKSKRDFLYRNGLWRNKTQTGAFVKCIFNKNIKKLLVSHGDEEFRRIDQNLFTILGIRKIYSTNVNILNQSDKLIAIPIGLTNKTNESMLHSILGDQTSILNILKTSQIKKNKLEVYVNIDQETNRERKKLLIKIKDCPHINIDNPVYSKEGRIKYLNRIRKSAFVLCPRGNGIDTHRFWETLYLGSVPVVLRKDLPIKGIDKKLPVLVIDDWNQVMKLDYLRQKNEQLTKIEHSSEMLTYNYWVEIIKGDHYSFSK